MKHKQTDPEADMRDLVAHMRSIAPPEYTDEELEARAMQLVLLYERLSFLPPRMPRKDKRANGADHL